jgi:hypothetical protein
VAHVADESMKFDDPNKRSSSLFGRRRRVLGCPHHELFRTVMTLTTGKSHERGFRGTELRFTVPGTPPSSPDGFVSRGRESNKLRNRLLQLQDVI